MHLSAQKVDRLGQRRLKYGMGWMGGFLGGFFLGGGGGRSVCLYEHIVSHQLNSNY